MISPLNISDSFTQKLDTIRYPLVSVGACSYLASVLLKQNTFLPKLLSLPILFCASIINTNSLRNDPNPAKRTDAIFKSFSLIVFMHLLTRPFSVVFSTLASVFVSRLFTSSFTNLEINPPIFRDERPNDRFFDGSFYADQQTFVLPRASFTEASRLNFAPVPEPFLRQSSRQYSASPSRISNYGQRHNVGIEITSSHPSYEQRGQTSRHAEFCSSPHPGAQAAFSHEESRHVPQSNGRFNDSTFSHTSAYRSFAAPIVEGFAQGEPLLSSVNFDSDHSVSRTSPRFGLNQQRSLRGKRHQVQSDLSDGVERHAQLNVAEQESVETVSILNPRLQPGQRHVVQSKNSSQQSETISGMQNQEARAAFASGGLSFLQQSGFSHQTNETQNRSAFAAPENTSQARSAFGRPA